MGNAIHIDRETCTGCGLCAEICPIRLIQRDEKAGLTFRPDRLALCIRCGQCMAVCPFQAIIADGLDFKRDFFSLPEGRSADMSYDELIKTRRAIRVFKERPVPRELLARVVEAIALAPPSFPPLKTELVVVQDPAVIRQALPAMIEVYEGLVKGMGHLLGRFMVRQKVGETTYRTLVNHVVPLMKSRLPELKLGLEDTITRYAPAMILFHADRQAEKYKTDIYIALTYGFLAAHAVGLGGTPIDLIPPAIENSPALRKLFSIPERNVVVAALILGYPKVRFQQGIKRELRKVIWIEEKKALTQ